ncbi:MAG TPA: hypothetical protein VFP72_15480 [Kineosporiaceae bacterium]|nr:hypothetical protein [Kineosporiaceae bacterium]
MTAHHRRTPTDRRTAADRPPAGPPGPDDDGSAEGSGAPDVESVAARGSGGEVETVVALGGGGEVAALDPPPIAGVQAWCPRPATAQELDDARTVLVVHRLDPGTGRCAACAADCPCPPALAAGRVLAEAGAWNTMPFTRPIGRPAGQGSAVARAGWVARLVRRLPWVTKAE